CGYVVMTTPNGILDHEEAMRQNVGGQVLGFFHKELVFLMCVNGHQEGREHISIRKESNACCISDPATMGVSCDYASSILLCAEDNNSILVFDEDEELGINQKAQWSGLGKICEQKDFFLSGFLLSFLIASEECLFALLKKESEYTPTKEYAQWLMRGSLDISIRKNTIDWIMKVDNVLNHCAYMEKDKVMKCYEVIQDMRLVEMRSSLVSKAPQTPKILAPTLTLSESIESLPIGWIIDNTGQGLLFKSEDGEAE
ncbi:hypothetical protein HPP92_028572, partial [Vanilla planifolia]